MQKQKGRTICLIVCFDYRGYPKKLSELSELQSSDDGRRIASLARASGVDVKVFSDQSHTPFNSGFPRKEVILQEMKDAGAALQAGETFVFFFAGHGAQAKRNSNSIEGLDESLCFVDPDGSDKALQDEEVANVLINSFKKETRVVLITDSHHSGSVCRLSRPQFEARPILHLAAIRDSLKPQDLDASFTSALVDTVESFVNKDGRTELSVAEVFNKCVLTHGNKFKGQDFHLECTHCMDPGAAPWPLMPTKGWTAQTALDADLHVLAAQQPKPLLMPPLCC